MNDGKEPMSLSDVVYCFNEAFKESGYDVQVTEEMVASAYAGTVQAYDIWGFRPTVGDPNAQALLALLPSTKRKKALIASLDVSRKSGPEDLIPQDYPVCYWVLDFEVNEVISEYDAYKKYKNGKVQKPNQA